MPYTTENFKKWKENNQEKYRTNKKKTNRSYRLRKMKQCKAYKMVYAAVKCGDLIKKPCCICGRNDFVCAHHEDYNKPLDVKWICCYCHNDLHLCIKFIDKGLNELLVSYGADH